MIINKVPLLLTPNLHNQITCKKELVIGGINKEKFGRINIPYQPRVELRYFSGNNLKEWLRKCNKYFTIYQIPKLMRKDSMKAFLEGKVEV